MRPVILKEGSTAGGDVALSDPTLALRDSFLLLISEFRLADEYYSHHDAALTDFDAFLKQLRSQSRGTHMALGHVPMTTFWMVMDGDKILGESRLRHTLTPALRVEGGHIGYAIRPSARRKGYGTRILELTLEKASQRGLERVLVTCDTDNLPSARIIEKNGGVLSGNAVSPHSGKPVSQYWILL